MSTEHAYVLLADPLRERRQILATPPQRVGDIAHYLPSRGPRRGNPLEMHRLDEPVLGVDAAGRRVAAELVGITWASKPVSENDSSWYEIGDKKRARIYGPALLAARPPEAGPLGTSPLDPTNLLRLYGDVEALDSFITFESDRPKPPEDGKRYNLDQLDSFLRLVCEGAWQGVTAPSYTLRLVSHDRFGEEASSLSLDTFRWGIARRFALDEFDRMRHTSVELVLREPVEQGAVKPGRPVARFMERATTEAAAELVVQVPEEKPIWLKWTRPILHLRKERTPTIKPVPVPGLPRFGEDGSERLVTWRLREQ